MNRSVQSGDGVNGVDVLILVEDPGAVNYLASIPAALSNHNIKSALVAGSTLESYMRDRDFAFQLLAPDDDETRLIARFEPRLVIVGTSENPLGLGLGLTEYCRRQNVPTLAAIDMAVNAERRFRGQTTDALRYMTDWLAVPDAATKRRYVELGAEAERIIICGHPHYDRVRARRSSLEGADRDKLRAELFAGLDLERPIIVFAAEGVDQLNLSASFRSEGYMLHGRNTSDFRTAIVLEEVLDAAAASQPRPQVVLRLHPKMSVEGFSDYADDVDLVSQGDDPLPLLWAADGVVGLTSMLMLEAYLLDRPTLSVLPRKIEAEWLVSTANGLTPVACNREQVADGLKKLIAGARGCIESEQEGRDDILPVDGETKFVGLIDKILARDADISLDEKLEVLE